MNTNQASQAAQQHAQKVKDALNVVTDITVEDIINAATVAKDTIAEAGMVSAAYVTGFCRALFGKSEPTKLIGKK